MHKAILLICFAESSKECGHIESGWIHQNSKLTWRKIHKTEDSVIVNMLSTNLFQDMPILRELTIYLLFFTKIINAPKKQDENLTEEEKLDRSVSAVYITNGLSLKCFGFYTLNLQLLIYYFFLLSFFWCSLHFSKIILLKTLELLAIFIVCGKCWTTTFGLKENYNTVFLKALTLSYWFLGHLCFLFCLEFSHVCHVNSQYM